MKLQLLLISIFMYSVTFAQVSVNDGIYFAKSFSKEQALYRAKEYVITEIIGLDTNLIKFEIDPLAATSSGELTSLVYECQEKNMSGLVFGFFGERWNESGVTYQAYAFKNLTESKALDILSRIDEYKDQENKYLSMNPNKNNIFFQYDDLTFLIYREHTGIEIRVFWNGFDSEWESIAFNRTKKRFEKKIKD